MNIELLRRHAGSEAPPAAIREIDVDGITWTWTTQGSYIVALRGNSGHEQTQPGANAIDDDVVRTYIRIGGGPGPEIEVAQLQTWLEPPLWPEDLVCGACEGVPPECKECRGEGYVECICSDCGDDHMRACRACDGKGVTCETCKGEGTVNLPKMCRPGRLAGALIDRNLLARALQGLGGRARVIGPSEPESQVGIGGSDFRIVLMPMREGHPLAEFPSYDPWTTS